MVACAYNPSYSGGWGRRIAWTQEAEVVVSQDRAIALQPGRQSETVSKTTTEKRKNKNSIVSHCITKYLSTCSYFSVPLNMGGMNSCLANSNSLFLICKLNPILFWITKCPVLWKVQSSHGNLTLLGQILPKLLLQTGWIHERVTGACRKDMRETKKDKRKWAIL